MGLGYIKPQAEWLYNDGWTVRLDDSLLHSISYCKQLYEWDGEQIPDYALDAMSVDMNMHNAGKRSATDIAQWIAFFKQRYRVFKHIAEHDDTIWIEELGIVTAALDVWRSFFKANAFAQAYYLKAEPEFRRFLILFGHDNAAQESEKTEVLKGSSTHDASESVALRHSHGDEDEVTSPGVKQTRRKLFNLVDEPSDRGSTNEDKSWLLPKDTLVENHFPAMNAFPCNVGPSGPWTEENLASSSCASSSPFKKWAIPFWPKKK